MASRGDFFKSIVSFNSGELSPLLDGRVDLDKYASGCRQLRNAKILTYGGIERRPGLQYIATAKHGDKKCRMIEFQFSTTTTYAIEAGDLYFRFYSNGGRIEVSGTPYEISTPYTEAQLFEIQWAQINDVMYLVHPEVSPRKLSRVTDSSWTLEELEFDLPPLLDENLTSTTITASGTSGTITLTSSASLFVSDHVGAYFQLGHRREADTVERNITSNGQTTGIETRGEWNLRTYGIWVGDILLQRSEDGGTTWETIRKWTGKEDRNIDAAGEESEEVQLRAKVENYSAPTAAGSTTPRVVLEVVDNYIYGLAKVTGYTSATEVDAEVVNEFHSTAATKVWSESSWSPLRGYPKTVTVYQQRIFYAGSSHQPQTVWASRIEDYEDFTVGTLATDGFNYTMGAQERNAIEWLVAQKDLLIGTSGGEWSMGAGSLDEVISPDNVLVKRQSTYGSRALRGTLVNEVVLFIQRQGRKVREFVYSIEKDSYVSPDLTLLSEHITDNGILDTAYQQQDDSVFWAVTEEGNLIGMTYERAQNVVGWHKHDTDGLFESVASIYGSDEDEVWVSVQRTVNGSTVRYIERFNPVEWESKEDAFYVDSGLTYDGVATDTVSGADHLEGKTVDVLADGAPVQGLVVSSGSVTLPFEASVIHLGLPYETTLQPMRLDVDPSAGVSQGQFKAIREIVVRFYKTLGCSYSDGIDAFETLSFRDTDDEMDDSPPLFTGDKEIEFEGGYEFEGNVILKQSQPLPMTVLAMVIKYQITGR